MPQFPSKPVVVPKPVLPPPPPLFNIEWKWVTLCVAIIFLSSLGIVVAGRMIIVDKNKPAPITISESDKAIATAYFSLGVHCAQNVIIKHIKSNEPIPDPNTLLKETINEVFSMGGEQYLKKLK